MIFEVIFIEMENRERVDLGNDQELEFEQDIFGMPRIR
jgi:hypothetical protein